MRFMDQSGKRFGRWTVLRRIPTATRTYYECICDCGTVKPVESGTLKSGASPSCGCGHKKHGLWDHPLYATWRNMLARCEKQSCHAYADYGGRGIKVCDRWKGDDGLANFIADMGDRPSSRHTVGRMDNNRDYEPSNCQWETMLSQSTNKRTSKILEHNGESMCAAHWADKIGMSRMYFHNKLKSGMTVGQVIEYWSSR